MICNLQMIDRFSLCVFTHQRPDSILSTPVIHNGFFFWGLRLPNLKPFSLAAFFLTVTGSCVMSYGGIVLCLLFLPFVELMHCALWESLAVWYFGNDHGLCGVGGQMNFHAITMEAYG